MRRKFIMSQAQYDKLIEACKPVPMIALQCGSPPTPQERANAAWEALGREMGFKYMTVRPGRTDLEFTAEVADAVD
jgi:hypothetical protein